MLIETKHIKITAELEQRITEGYYREKLPPLRSLMKEYHVSLQTISKAVKPLIMSGLVSPGPRGSAINHASAVRERYYAWGLLCSGSAEITNATHDFFQLIHQCLARDSYNMLFLDGRNKRLRQDTEFWEKQPIDGLVFGYGTLTAELAWTVHRAGIAEWRGIMQGICRCTSWNTILFPPLILLSGKLSKKVPPDCVAVQSAA